MTAEAPDSAAAKHIRGGTADALPQRRTSFALFVWAFVGVGLMLGAWSFATPIGAAPDEAAHTTQAVAIVRGQFNEPRQPWVRSQFVIGWARVPCWIDSPWAHVQAPACTPGHATTVLVPTQYSNAPPLYYVVVGIPSLSLSGSHAIYAMRVLGDLVNAALVALGIWLLLRYYPRRTPLLGVLLALSPMALFMMAVLNSSGLEIASGFAAWCGGLCVVTYLSVPRALAVWTAVAMIVLVLARAVSPLDAIVIAVVLAFFVGWRGLRKRVNPSLRPLWIPVAVSLGAAAIFLLIFGTISLIGFPPRHPASLLSNMDTSLRLTGGYLEQCVGNFGLLDIPAPTWVVAVWTACVTALAAVALILSAPCRRALPVLALAVVVIVVALQAPQMNKAGPWFQGRYILPIVIGLPLVASCFEWRGRRFLPQRTLPRAVLVVGIVLFAAQFAAFDQALRHYRGGHIPLYAPGAWFPPGGEFPVQAVFVIGAAVTLVLLVVMSSSASVSRPTSFSARSGARDRGLESASLAGTTASEALSDPT